jgi:hypothetical protein
VTRSTIKITIYDCTIFIFIFILRLKNKKNKKKIVGATPRVKVKQKKKNEEEEKEDVLATGVDEVLSWATRVVRPPPNWPVWGWPNHP